MAFNEPPFKEDKVFPNSSLCIREDNMIPPPLFLRKDPQPLAQSFPPKE